MERIQKLIAQSGLTSRRKAEELILAKRVKVNGNIAHIGLKASWKDKIVVDGKPLKNKEDFVYYLLNKPKNTITSLKDEKKRPTVVDLIAESRRIFPVGRLDFDTKGVLIFTNDGNLAHKLMHPSFEVLRVYEAFLDKDLKKEEMAFLNSKKVIINNKFSLQKVEKIRQNLYSVTLNVGSYHHIKKLFGLVRKQVVDLKRIKYAQIGLSGLLPGEYRKLTFLEIQQLKKLTNK